ncbi:MAG: hypothetical protein K9I85_11540 [Saprospiraceae bacterium]|nr:hypothetical protein [Saprospiraceae bacterium]
MNTQEIFLQHAQALAPKNKPFAELLTELLDISLPAAYNRLNGKSRLTLDEVVLLSQFFQISIDRSVSQYSDEVRLKFQPINGHQPLIRDYLHHLYNDLTKLTTLEGIQIRYASSEIPIFYYFHFPMLAAFKLYLWGRTIWNDPSVENQAFSIKDWGGISRLDTEQIMHSILSQYTRIPSIELWHTHLIDNTINQILYFSDQGLIEDEETKTSLLSSVEALLDLLESFARKGKKWVPGLPEKAWSSILTIHHNETTHTNNTVLITSPEFAALYFSFDNPNFMQTADQRLTEYTQEWFEKLIRRSPMVSTHGNTYRVRLFQMLRQRLNSPMVQIST